MRRPGTCRCRVLMPALLSLALLWGCGGGNAGSNALRLEQPVEVTQPPVNNPNVPPPVGNGTPELLTTGPIGPTPGNPSQLLALTDVDVGVGVGGTQDAEVVREVVGNGYVPYPEALTYEAYFNDYDLSLPSTGCELALCPVLACGVLSPDGTGLPGSGFYVQLGFDSRYTQYPLPDPPKDIVFVADVSGSMREHIGVEYRTLKIDLLKSTLLKVFDVLNPEDRVGLITFSSSASLQRNLTALGNGESASSIVQQWEANGGTNMEDGISKGLGLFEMVQQSEGRLQRIVLLTDALPNIGATNPSSFMGMIGEAAKGGIGLTLVGFGINFGADLVYQISSLPGGISLYIDGDEAASRFADEFLFNITPVATEFNFIVSSPLADTMEIYGIPGKANLHDPLENSIGGLFLNSEGGGGVFFRTGLSTAYEAEGDIISLAYHYRDLGGTEISGEISLDYGDSPSGQSGIPVSHYDAVSKGMALVRYIQTFRQAIEFYADGSTTAAVSLADDLANWFDSQGELFSGEPHYPEDVNAISSLAENMRNSAEILVPDPSGIFY